MAKNRRRCFFDITIDGREAGRVVFELFDDLAPKCTENFLQLCTGKAGIGKNSGKHLSYKGSTIHRVIKDFMIQGGDFTEGNGTGGESIYGGSFDDEAFIAKHDQPFLLSMANKGPNTNGSQFFVTVKPTPHLNGKHVVFGKVVSGKEVITEIEHLRTDSTNRPLADVIIISGGELVRKRRQESSSDSSDDERSKSRKKRRQSGSEGEKENGKDEVQVSTVKAEDLPPEPTNQHSFLMRRSKTPEHKKKEKESGRRRDSSRDRHRRVDTGRDRSRRGRSRTRSPRRRSRDRGGRDDRRGDRDRDTRRNERVEKATGVKTKGRGVMRFRFDRSRTPPHWKREEDRLMTLEELQAKREALGGDSETVVKRMKGTHADANEDATAEEKKEVKAEVEESAADVTAEEMEGGEGIDLHLSDEEEESDGGMAEEAKEQERLLQELNKKKAEEARKEEEEKAKEAEKEESDKEVTAKSPTPERRKRSPSPEAKKGRSRSRSASSSPERRRSRSTERKKSRSPAAAKKSPARRRSRSKDRRRSRSRSHDRRRSGERRRHDSDRKRRSRSRDRRSPDRRRKDSHHERDTRRRHSPVHSRRRGRSRSSS